MPGFDLLNFPLNKRCFLEASAGTGKTFAIETLVVRHILEGVSIDEILVVTFTKAATNELKTRIRQKIVTTLPAVEDVVAKKRCGRALDAIEEAKIYTIHSFCFKALEENPIEGEFSLGREEESGSPKLARMIVKDHLRTENALAPGQLEILLKSFGGDFEKLVEATLRLAEKRVPIECGRSFKEISEEFFKEISLFTCTPEEVFGELIQAAPCFEKMSDRQKNLKKEVVEDLKNFSSLFGEKKTFPLSGALLGMKEEALLKRAKMPSLPLWARIQQKLLPLIVEASCTEKILSLVAEGARNRLEKVTKEEEIFFFQDLLLWMQKRVKDPLFAARIRNKYKAVFIDEFQDTDRVQWEIFSTLFSNHPLCLIGDPKQSIYRFRHADLYTYMEAKKSFGRDEQASLEVNYRSSPELISALNALLTPIPDFLYLPKTKEGAHCPPLYPAPTTREPILKQDGRGAVHFFVSDDEEEFFSFITNEIKKLHRENKIPLNRFAVLVKDRFQGADYAAYARAHSLPAATKRTRSLLDSPAFQLLQDFIQAVLHPKDRSLLCKTLVPFGWSDLQLKNLDHRTIERFFALRCTLECEGILACLKTFLDQELQQDEALYSDLLQLAEMAAMDVTSLDGYGPFFSKLKNEGADAEKLEARSIESADAVQIMTIHVSKGLEFDVVFPIGLIKGVAPKKEIVADLEKGVLTASEEAFAAHLEEIESEKMRLLYVAFTRARERLYLPVLEKEKKSPMQLFLDKRLQGKSLEEFVQGRSEITLSSAKCEEIKLETPPHVTLTPPVKPEFAFTTSTLKSFSSLAPSPLHKELASDGLPSGKEFGQFLHTLFEHERWDQMIERSDYREWKPQILSLMSSALHCPLDNFCLADVDPKKQIKEMEFLYPDGKGDFFKGFIDLVFEHEGKVYFLDWKSNLLENYSPEKLKEAMVEHDYFLQAKIYEQAVVRYFSLFGKPVFGGAFYLFLRGPAVYKVEFENA